jgi:hypothetical protein
MVTSGSSPWLEKLEAAAEEGEGSQSNATAATAARAGVRGGGGEAKNPAFL